MVKKEGACCISKCIVCRLAIFAVVVFVLHAIFIFSGMFSEYKGLIGNVFIVLFSLMALISIFILYFKFPENFPQEKRGNLFLVLGVLLFFLGDLVWLIDELFLDKLVPIGVFPDFLWNLGYVFFIVATIFFISFSFRPSKKLLYWLVIIGFIFGGAIIYQDVSEDLELGTFDFTHAIQDMYIVYDVVLVVLIIYLAWPMVFVGNKLFYGMFILAFGFFTRIIYDRIFAQMSEEMIYYTGHPIDLLYIVFYLCIIFKSAYKMRMLCKNG